MTDCPSTDVDTLNSRIDDNEAHLSLRNPSPVSRNRRSQQEPRYEKESLGDGKEREMQPPESNLSSHLIDAAGRHISDTATIAFAALLHIPSPLLVLSNRKTVVVANYAIEELLGLDTAECDEETRAPDGRQGKSLSQLGIQLVQDEHQNQVSWEEFLDIVAEEKNQRTVIGTEAGKSNNSSRNTSDYIADATHPQSLGNGRSGPTVATKQRLSKLGGQSLVHDVVVDVRISSPHAMANYNQPGPDYHSSDSNVSNKAQMVISPWTMENTGYFTLTFVCVPDSPLASNPAQPRSLSQVERRGELSATSTPVISSPTSLLGYPGRGSSTATTWPSITSASYIAPSSASPLGTPGTSHMTTLPAVLEKVSRMKEAMIDSMEIPVVAMWKDESLAIANQAASALMHQVTDSTSYDAYDLLAKFKIYTEDFGRQLKSEEYPIVQICRSRKPFGKLKLGILDSKSQRKRFDVSGEIIVDEITGEFLAGIIFMKDVTEYAEMITNQFEANQLQFQLICDTIPQMLWITDPKGAHEWFSKRWSEYTGLSVEGSLGENWQYAFHPEDVTNAFQRWRHSLDTGEEYMTEYRCKRFDGAWRWMLGRALPLREAKTGKITKWFGTCTDIHDLVEARQEAKRTREHLLFVIKHALVTVWAVDRSRKLTFLEGGLLWDENSSCNESAIGKNVYDVFGKHKGKDYISFYKEPIDQILDGKDSDRTSEHFIDGNKRWYRTRFVPMLGNLQISSDSDPSQVEGVIGVSMDVTELKQREAELQSQEQENFRLHSAETAAKEASRLKSQFLANMSHEIRTPIAGVIGMSELLIDTELDEEQRECAETIQRSANGLLTVINDILDLSKVESGRLDVEEVQFSLSVVIRDVSKMLSFAAGRKHLAFESNIQLGGLEDLIVMGDPGRLRQILTNLLTNSIKFTSVGSVTLAVAIREETDDTIEVVFAVEDTGIGIEEEVRKRLFKPFSQADSSTARRFGGTGLGLTICKNVTTPSPEDRYDTDKKQLVDLMHGQITLDSTLGIGTHATFTIPFNKPQFRGGASPLINLEPIPPRLQSDLSLSSCASDHGSVTPPQNPSRMSGKENGMKKSPTKDSKSSSFLSASSGSEGISNTERGHIHVLVVEDNPVNQQIALKTIKKFGFSVNAVWNGREALDYLLATPSVDHPKPDIILMDVQMPILDGYRATHLLRHHSPYTSIDGIRAVPIIAMTASAIQGDKEKCEEAGMNDYLAKPVKAKTLEKMLLKWAKRRKAILNESLDLGPADIESICTEPETSSYDPNTPHRPIHPSEDHMCADGISISDTPPWIESEGDRDMQRCEAEEKATSLRDDKLLAASSGHPYTRTHVGPSLGTSMRPGTPTPALTEENMGILGREHDEPPPTNSRLPTLTRDASGEHSSMQPGSGHSSTPSSTVGSLHGHIGQGKSWSGATRRRLNRNDSDRSQVTVTESRAGK